MSDLEQFYEERIRPSMHRDPDFSELNEQSIKAMKGSVTFSFWKLNQSLDRLKSVCKRAVGMCENFNDTNHKSKYHD